MSLVARLTDLRCACEMSRDQQAKSIASDLHVIAEYLQSGRNTYDSLYKVNILIQTLQHWRGILQAKGSEQILCRKLLAVENEVSRYLDDTVKKLLEIIKDET